MKNWAETLEACDCSWFMHRGSKNIFHTTDSFKNDRESRESFSFSLQLSLLGLTNWFLCILPERHYSGLCWFPHPALGIESGRRLEERNWVSNLDSSGGSSYLRAKLAALWEHTEILNFGYLCLSTSTSNTQSCLWVYVYRLLKKVLHFSSAKLLYQFRKCLLLKGSKN